ncbi:hypothetical protein E2C01_060133 [Portunus trituberculatus]|uniref:Uncharacterized protein n=1 Tax=Portunus trituberculatus TaxID=210409 RepID=A0A5B7H1E6_PORTR|nr:hypothetical protein [Portunus trituberculatus]
MRLSFLQARRRQQWWRRWWWWMLLVQLLQGLNVQAEKKTELLATRGKNKSCGTSRVARWRGVDCLPLYTTSIPTCAPCVMYIPTTRVLPPETIPTSHQAVLAELLTRYTITTKPRKGAHIKVNCNDVRKLTIGLANCTISSAKGKVTATQVFISLALHRGLLRLSERRNDAGKVKCKGIPSFYVQEVAHN